MKPSMVVYMPAIPALKRLWQDDGEFESSEFQTNLDYIWRP
jgi:hypothetical protein